jgi:hypothetical protein
MKEFLRLLYKRNKRDFDVWNYLWLFSDNNSIDFTHAELCGKFNLPPSSLYRTLNSNIESLNTNEKTFIEYEKVSYRNYKITFYPKGKKSSVPQKNILYNELYVWLKDYYEKIEFDYDDMLKHKKYIVTICGKIKRVMKSKNNEVTDESLKNTFIYFIEHIDDWWKETGNITLPLISKHFTKLLNQVKKSNGTRKKSDSYSKSAEQVDSIDFSKITRK